MIDLGVAVEVGIGILAQIVVSARRDGKVEQMVLRHDQDIRDLWSAKTKTDDRVGNHGERIATAEARLGIER